MPATRTTPRRGLTDRFARVLTAAAEQRHQRDYWAPHPDGGQELAWARFEREQMLTAVNEAREERGLSPTTMAAVADVERVASGHVDYVTKFSLYCAELVLDGRRS